MSEILEQTNIEKVGSISIDSSLNKDMNEDNKEKVSNTNEALNMLEVKMFSDIFIGILLNNDSLNKFTIKINEDTKKIIIKLLNKSPDFLNDIEKMLINVVKDNKIDFSDIPNIISVIQKMYVSIYNFKNEFKNLNNKKTAEVTGIILKLIIHYLVQEGKIKIEENKKIEFLELIDKLLDNSISLLTISKIIKKRSCTNCLFALK